MLVDKKITILVGSKLSTRKEMGKFFFCLILDNCNYLQIKTNQKKDDEQSEKSVYSNKSCAY